MIPELIGMALLAVLLFTQPRRKVPTPIEWTTVSTTGSGPLEPVLPPHDGATVTPHSSTVAPSPSLGVVNDYLNPDAS